MPKIKRTTIELEDELKPDLDKPYCTCASSGKYAFDQKIGTFVHRGLPGAGEGCYKPSKGYYEHALEAGILLQ